MYRNNKQIARRKTVSALAPKVQSNNEEMSAFGAVVKLGHYSTSTPLVNFSCALTSASGANKNYIIGDPSGMIADLLSGTFVSPDSASSLVAAMKASFAYAPVAISGINYKVTTSANQFNNAFKYHVADIDGAISSRDLRPAIAERNSMQNTKLLTLDLTTNPIVLGPFSAITLVVTDGEDVYLDFTVAGAVGRI